MAIASTRENASHLARWKKASARLRRSGRRLWDPGALLQIGLLALTLALFALWLALPDGTAAERALSVTLAVIGAALLLWAQSAVLIVLRRTSTSRGSRRSAAWKGALLLLGIALFYFLVMTFFAAGTLQDTDRADRLLGQTWMWHIADRRSLVAAQGVVWWLLRWLLAGALLPVTMEGAARGMRGPWMRVAITPLRHWLFWAVLLAVAAVCTAVTMGLLELRPQLPIPLEVLFGVFKAGVIFAADAGGACFVLLLTATYLRDCERLGQVAGVSEGSRRPSGRARRVTA